MGLPASLADALEAIGWTPRRLATAINAWLSRHGKAKLRIDATTPYAWLPPRSYVPRAPLPDVVAIVISDQLGCRVTAGHLWPLLSRLPREVPDAVHGLAETTSLEQLLSAIGELTTATGAAEFDLHVSRGVDLTAAVLDKLYVSVQLARRTAERDWVLGPQVDLIASHIAALRRLDDRHGGGALSVRYVTAELRAVLDLLAHGSYEARVGRDLMCIVADLGQLLGWLQFDSGRHGLAQRYLLLSARMAQAVGMAGRSANAVGMLAYVSAFAGHGLEAMQVADAASRQCPPGDPVLMARIKGRQATAAAAAGDLSSFRAASMAAQDLVNRSPRSDVAPFLYYVEPEQLAAEAGQGLVVLAERAVTYRRRLLDEAVDLLEPLSRSGARPDYPRSALVHATFLAKAHLMRRDLDSVVEALRWALERLADVQSPRGRTYLHELRPALVHRKRAVVVRDFLPEFDAALSES